ncbi:carboxypeptidase N subunit 2-like [Ptychodera flava]|uniref:carboxypeptidase N subunit 2-like n=1 Tax=Ptychodera flava TaxID=63121 RepID=UPI00396A43D2
MFVFFVRIAAVLVIVRRYAASCPDGCACNRRAKDVDCVNGGYTSIPAGIPVDTKTLSLSGNTLAVISETCLANFSDMQTLNLNGTNISSIEDNAFMSLPTLSRLTLSNNKLSVIGSFLQNLPSIRNLSLAMNGIRELNDQVFRGTWHIRHLDLGSNQFETLPSDPLQNLTELEELILTGNRLTSVPSYGLQTLTKLRTLDLRNNRIKELFTNAFRGMNNLKVLMLDGNELVNLESGELGGLDKLSTLSLNRNRLVEVDIDAFSGTYMLSKIDFTDNKFENIPTESLQSLLNLKVLSFSRNGLSQLQTYPFLPLSSLEYLFLDSASLDHIESSTLNGLVRMKGLSLRNNSLEYLPADVFDGVTDLEIVLLSGNPWACGCQLKGFLETAKAKPWLIFEPEVVLGNSVFSVDPPSCQTPDEWKGKYLEDVPTDEIQCPLSTHDSFTIESEEAGISTDLLKLTTDTIEHFTTDWTTRSFTTEESIISQGTDVEVTVVPTTEKHYTTVEVETEITTEGASEEEDGTLTTFDSTTTDDYATASYSTYSEQTTETTFQQTSETTSYGIESTQQTQEDTEEVPFTKNNDIDKRKLITVAKEPVRVPSTITVDAGANSAKNDTYIPTIVSSIIAGALGVVLVGIMVYFVLGIGCRQRRHNPVYRIKSIDSISAGDRRGSGTEFLVLNTDNQDDEEVYNSNSILPQDQESSTENSSPMLPLGLQETRLVSEFTTLAETTVHYRRPSDDFDNPVASLLGNS